MPSEDQIEELKQIIEEEKQAKKAYQKEKYKVWADRNTETLKQKGKNDRAKFRLKIMPHRRAYRRRIKEEFIALKGGKCADCGGIFPSYAYDFHHVDGKDMKLGSFMSISRPAMLEELNKCVLLCAICHRGRHVMNYEDEEPTDA